MITPRFYTIVVRKDALAAKWPGGVEGFKRDHYLEGSTQEDENLITAGYSMGTDLDLMLAPLKKGGLCLYEMQEALQRVPRKAPWLFRVLLGEIPANYRFGRDELRPIPVCVDIAIATLGAPTQRCPWLEPVPGTHAVRFVKPAVKPA